MAGRPNGHPMVKRSHIRTTTAFDFTMSCQAKSVQYWQRENILTSTFTGTCAGHLTAGNWHSREKRKHIRRLASYRSLAPPKYESDSPRMNQWAKTSLGHLMANACYSTCILHPTVANCSFNWKLLPIPAPDWSPKSILQCLGRASVFRLMANG
mgnify:CR=1 FL=1